MRLYKYISLEGTLRFVQSAQLRFTQAAEFNDPFEMQPFFRGPREETVKGKFQSEFDLRARTAIEEQLNSRPPEERNGFDMGALWKAMGQKPESTERIVRLANIATSFLDGGMRSALNTTLGVLCLTENPTNLLMWAHYANHHRGAVIGFDTRHAFFKQAKHLTDGIRRLRKVVYKLQRPAISMESEYDDLDLLYFKSTDWEYEQEWRLILPLDNCSRRIDRQPGYPVCLFNVPPECVRSILLGCRMPPSSREQLMRFLRSESRYRHVVIEQAEMDKRKFIIRRRAISKQALDEWFSRVS